MLLRVDPNADTPLYEQIAGGLRRAIEEGEVEVGEQLPPARALAESLEVNLHTVLRAYQVLRAEGLVEMRRGRGVTVLEASRGRAEVTRHARTLLASSRKHGLSLSELTALLESLP